MKQVKEMGIVAVCLMLLGFGICMGIGTYLMYRDGEEEYDTLREYVAVEELKENADGEELPQANDDFGDETMDFDENSDQPQEQQEGEQSDEDEFDYSDFELEDEDI